jgi:aryl-alcohol dehydrogenase-like predicted oxidoreductase
MTPINFPNTDLTVSPLCFGVSGFGTDVSPENADELLQIFLEAGGDFFDTAHCYAFWVPGGLGASERALGEALRRAGVENRVVVATKGGHPDMGQGYSRPAEFLSEAVIRADVQESLDRLKRDTIDLYYLHRDDGKTPVSEVVGLLNVLVQEGKIRYFGASNWSVERIGEANAYAVRKGLFGFVASQIQGSLAIPNWKPEPQDPTVRYLTDWEQTFHTETQMPVVCYSATANGYFARNPRSENLYGSSTNERRREHAERLAQEFGCTPAQIAIAYLRSLPCPAIPLFGTTNPDHLREIVGGVEIRLTPEQVSTMLTP